MKKISLVLALVSVLFFQIQANAATIDFEDLYGTPIFSGGIALMPVNYANLVWPLSYLMDNNFPNPAYEVIAGNVSAWTLDYGSTIAAPSNSTFDLVSIILSPTYELSDTVRFEAYRNNSVVYGESFNITKTLDLMTGVWSFTEIHFGSGFANIDKVFFWSTANTDQIVFDNLVFNSYVSTPAPEPATMILFGTGLAGLVGAVRRKKKA